MFRISSVPNVRLSGTDFRLNVQIIPVKTQFSSIDVKKKMNLIRKCFWPKVTKTSKNFKGGVRVYNDFDVGSEI